MWHILGASHSVAHDLSIALGDNSKAVDGDIRYLLCVCFLLVFALLFKVLYFTLL